jgi:type II secretory pathway pseudopilin PulG
VELVIAMALLAVSLLMGVLSGQSNLLTMGRNLNMSSQESLIEEDIASIRRLAERYTWCSGAGTLEAIANSSCRSMEPLTQNYYFPDAYYPDAPPPPDQRDTPPEATTAITAFTQACRGSGLTAPLVNAIQTLPLPEDLNLQRTVQLDNGDAAPGSQNHLLRIRYFYDRTAIDPSRAADFPPIDREVLILPTVAAWCP